MNFYLDTEFDGFGGPLISLAIVSQTGGHEFYWTVDPSVRWVRDEWVKKNVIPLKILRPLTALPTALGELRPNLEEFLSPFDSVHIIADWPEDVSQFCNAMLTGPGRRIYTPPITFEISRVDAYPTELEGAIQHNALWDARALRHILNKDNEV